MDYKQYRKQFTGEYLRYYDDLENILETYLLDSESKDMAMCEMVDLLQCASHDKRPCKDIFGSNLQRFCKQYVKGLKPYYKVENAITSVIAFCGSVLLCSWLMVNYYRMDNRIQDIMWDTFDGGSLIFIFMGIAGSVLANRVRRCFAMKKDVKQMRRTKTLMFMGCVLIGIIVAILMELFGVQLKICFGDILGVTSFVMILGVFAFLELIVVSDDNKKNQEAVIVVWQKEYDKKKQKGCSKEQYMAKKARECSIVAPVAFGIYVIFMAGLLVMLAFSLLGQGIAGIVGMEIGSLFVVWIATILVTSFWKQKQILKQLKEGKIRLD